MARTGIILGLTALAAVLTSTASRAAVLTDDATAWTANAGTTVFHTTQLGDDFDMPTRVYLNGGGSFTATDNYTGETVGEVRTVPSTWGAWSGGYTGQVLYSGDNSNSITLSLSRLSAFGFEVEPFSQDQDYSFTVTLASGDSLTDTVSGQGGARFFGFYGGQVDSLTIQTDDNGFAFGNFVSSPVSTVPLPAGAPLFGLALLALSGLGFGLKAKRQA